MQINVLTSSTVFLHTVQVIYASILVQLVHWWWATAPEQLWIQAAPKSINPARSIVVKRCQKCVYFQLPTAYRRHRSRMVHICPDYPPLSVSLKDLFALETIRRANHLVMRNHMESLNNKTTRHQGNTLQESTFKNSCVNMCQCVFQIV